MRAYYRCLHESALGSDVLVTLHNLARSVTVIDVNERIA